MLTPEEMHALKPYREHLRHAQSDFMINPGREAIRLMDAIYRRATGTLLKTDSTCGACILNTLKRLGRLYFDCEAKANTEVATKAEKPKKRRKTAKE
jgi:hypothetical protein